MSKTDLHERINQFLNTALKKISVKDYDSAIEKLKGAEVLDKENPEILYNLGICYCKKELFHTAIVYFKKVHNLSYTFVDVITVLKMLSYTLAMIDELDQAKKYIDDGLKLSRNDTTLLNILGFILEKKNIPEKALITYREIIDIDNSNPNAYNSMAYIISNNNGDLNEALIYAKKALNSNPENPAYLDTMGYIQMKKGMLDIAKNYFKKALQILPDSKEIKAHINLLLNITPTKQ